MASCALTCKVWYHRSWFYLLGDIHLADRGQVVALFKRLRAEPRLQKVAKFATIIGTTDADRRQCLLHLGTFAVILARHLHKVETLTVSNADWPAGAPREDTVRNLGAFASLVSLSVSRVTFATASQLAHLISALPALIHLRCGNAQCGQTSSCPLVRVPLNASRIRTLTLYGSIAPVILDLLVKLRMAARLELLDINTHADMLFASDSKMYDLLNAQAAPLQRFRLSLGIVHSELLQQIEKNVNLSHHKELNKVVLNSWVSSDQYFSTSWIPRLLSSVDTGTVRRVHIEFDMRDHDSAGSLDVLLDTMAETDHFSQVDEILCRDNFVNVSMVLLGITVLTPVPLLRSLGFDISGGSWARWEPLVRDKMPRTNKRGILRANITRGAFNLQ